MAEEVGIVMSLYDRVSPTLKAIAGNSQAFDKTLDDLEESIKSYDKAQDSMVKKYADLKKAMAETDNQVKAAQKSYKKLNDEASKKALDEAIDRQAELRRALTETESNLKANSRAYDELYEQARKAAKGIRETEDAASRAENRADGASMLSTLGKAGITSMVGDSISQAAGYILESSVGQPTATAVSSVLSGIASGAAMGAVTGNPVGIAIGAAAGGLSGVLNAATTVGGAKDDAFKSYVQEAAEGQISERDTAISSGSSVAAQRELDAIAFDKLLYGQGDEFLAGLRETAARTPFEYADLTAMGRNLATGFGSDPERMLDLMTAIGDAGAAVGASTSDMQWMATALSRMQSTDLAQLGEINMFQDRDVDVIGMLAEAYGKNEGDIRSMISSGDIGGREAVSIIQAALSDPNGPYAGSMALMAETFDGLTSTLSDTMTEIDNATGEGYNEKAKEGLQADIDAYGGELGEALATANEIIGEGKAIAENLDRQYSREALSALTLGTDTTVYGEEQAARLQEMHGQYTDLVERYQTASEEDKAIIAAEIEALKEEAQAMADASYDASSMSQSLQDVDLALIAAIRDNTAALGFAAWGRDYRTSQELGKGQMAVSDDGGSAIASSYQDWVQASNTDAVYTPHAAGLDRVPYDNYAALLHEGERVLTAREAREQDRGASSHPISITVSGNTFGAGMDEAAVAEAIAQAVSRKLQAGFEV